MNGTQPTPSAAETNSADDSPGYGELPRPDGSQESGQGSPPAAKEEGEQTAQSTGGAVREKASDLVAGMGEELTKSVEDQKRRGVETVRSFAGAVETAAQELEQQSPQVARYARDAAQGLHSLAHNIEGRTLNDLMRSATALARSKPTLFIIGAVAAGFAIARLMRSSAPSHAPGNRERIIESDDTVYSHAVLGRESMQSASNNLDAARQPE